MNQQLKQEYQETEIGLIPEDWDIVSFDDVFDFLSTATYSRADLNGNGEILYVHYGDIHTRWNNFLDLNKNNLPSISKEKQKKYSLLNEGDLIMADASEDYEGIGKSVEVKNIGEKKVISGLHTFLLRERKGRIVNGFKGYIHSNQLVKKQFDRLATGLKVYGVSKNNLKSVLIPIPKDPKEQEAIAQVLSDTDNLIQELDKLLTKKKDIKKGAMQELLTGKKRLEGFKGEWEENQLGELVSFHKGSGLSKSKVGGKGRYKCILYGELFTRYGEVIKDVISKTDYYEGIPSIEGDILMPASTTTVGLDLAVASSLNKSNVLLGGDVNILRKKKNINSKFLAFYLTQVKKYEISMRTQGITIIHLYGKSISDLQITIPKDPKEQEAIANILSDMDSEIELLEQKRDKCKLLKVGMMQQLLTGRIRLI